MKIYTSIFLTIILFFSLSVPVATSSERISPSIEEQIDTLRYNNLVTLRYLNFKVKFGNYEQYYRTKIDSLLPE